MDSHLMTDFSGGFDTDLLWHLEGDFCALFPGHLMALLVRHLHWHLYGHLVALVPGNLLAMVVGHFVAVLLRDIVALLYRLLGWHLMALPMVAVAMALLSVGGLVACGAHWLIACGALVLVCLVAFVLVESDTLLLVLGLVIRLVSVGAGFLIMCLAMWLVDGLILSVVRFVMDSLAFWLLVPMFMAMFVPVGCALGIRGKQGQSHKLKWEVLISCPQFGSSDVFAIGQSKVKFV